MITGPLKVSVRLAYRSRYFVARTRKTSRHSYRMCWLRNGSFSITGAGYFQAFSGFCRTALRAPAATYSLLGEAGVRKCTLVQ